MARARTPPAYFTEKDHEGMVFVLEGLFPPATTLIFNPILGTLLLLAIQAKGGTNIPVLVKEEQFTTAEICVLLPILQSFPYYCSYATLLASLNWGRVTESTTAQAHERLQEATEAGTWDAEMRPVRNLLSRVRPKLRRCGIEIASILETGYMLKEHSSLCNSLAQVPTITILRGGLDAFSKSEG
ncbi:hypothetical protein [Ktedonospora formicarum]|uniref:Uncharacterized protein n=1 Tax=Ktedonospora formicarum TaxID=2778364 RepID=A0A8J3MWN9_9CHLR|nr:hypothetical protein [Ktedonospora formicarum]GHO49196.1 hypothetical protein KSX_73590 [Ktedonospora formicarum]